jgi:surfeit locus 1 family protein
VNARGASYACEGIIVPVPRIVSAGLLVLVAAVAFVALGIWQLARLDQRRAFNAEMAGRLQAVPLVLTGAELSEPVDTLKYRPVVVRGEYDAAHEQSLVNQFWQGQLGAHLVTPLVIAGSDRAVLVDRGWIPDADSAPERWVKFAEPGTIEVRGWIQPGENGSSQPALFPSQPRTWLRVDTKQMQPQAGHLLLPFYIQPAPKPDSTTPPLRSDLNLDLGEGPHLGYALTWFGLAVSVLVGFVALVRSGQLVRPSSDEVRTS